MALDDGRFLVSAERFDKLATQSSVEELTSQGLLRTHPDFRVIALGLPVPAFPGFPLDPPLRSRFQARFVDTSEAAHIPVSHPVLRSLHAVNDGLVRLARQADAIVAPKSDGSPPKPVAANAALHLLPVRACGVVAPLLLSTCFVCRFPMQLWPALRSTRSISHTEGLSGVKLQLWCNVSIL